MCFQTVIFVLKYAFKTFPKLYISKKKKCSLRMYHLLDLTFS